MKWKYYYLYNLVKKFGQNVKRMMESPINNHVTPNLQVLPINLQVLAFNSHVTPNLPGPIPSHPYLGPLIRTYSPTEFVGELIKYKNTDLKTKLAKI